MVPIERVRLNVNLNVEDVRRRIAKGTSEYATGLDILKFQVAKDPDLPLVGKVDQHEIELALNLGKNSGRPILKARLVDRGDQTTIEGWMGLHIAVIGALVVMTVVTLTMREVWPWFPAALTLMVGGGYVIERRKLLRALTECVSVDAPETDNRSSEDAK